jgi:two-component system chemotaxis response regulator CheB
VDKIIAIGASTGGVDALQTVFAHLPVSVPPIVVVIHMPVGFTALFATRVNANVKTTVKEAASGDVLRYGHIYIAPAGQHMVVEKIRGNLQLKCYVGEKVQSVIPSADVLFESLAKIRESQQVGVILTGLGADGAAGLLKMRQNGAETIGQDKETSDVYGMPKVAFERGAVIHQLPLGKIANKILTLTNRR